jgi:hypothetical protein
MNRLLIAMLVALGLALTVPLQAMGQDKDKAEKAPMPKTDVSVVVEKTTTWYGEFDKAVSVIGLALLALILFQLYLLRGSVEKLSEKDGA